MHMQQIYSSRNVFAQCTLCAKGKGLLDASSHTRQQLLQDHLPGTVLVLASEHPLPLFFDTFSLYTLYIGPHHSFHSFKGSNVHPYILFLGGSLTIWMPECTLLRLIDTWIVPPGPLFVCC